MNKIESSYNNQITNIPIGKQQKELIRKLALASLKELTVCLVYASITCCFVAGPVPIAMVFVSGITVWLFNTIMRSIKSHCHYKIIGLANQSTPLAEKERSKYLKRYDVADILAPTVFSIYDLFTRDMLTHEVGHTLAALAVYKNANPKIDIEFGKMGSTSYNSHTLTTLGSFFGKKGSECFVLGAGAGFAMIAHSINLVVAHKCEKTDPQMSTYLKAMAVVSIALHVLYALSALWLDVPGHDFIALKLAGFHPILSALSIIALPIFVKLGILLYNRVKKQRIVI